MQMKRFYSQVEINAAETGFEVRLDGRVLKSPAKSDLVLPNRVLAEKVMAEWQNVEDEIKPQHMPYFSSAATVIDRVMPNRDVLNTELVGYVDGELICYRASEDEAELAAQQTQSWDEWLLWLAQAEQVTLTPTTGIMPVSQDDAALSRAAELIAEIDDWLFSCLYRNTTLSGSFTLSLAALRGQIDTDRLFDLAFLDELYQNRKWGQDAEAAERQTMIKSELNDIAAFQAVL